MEPFTVAPSVASQVPLQSAAEISRPKGYRPCFGGLPFISDNRRRAYSQPPEYRESDGTIHDQSDYRGPGAGADSGSRRRSVSLFSLGKH